ncbi:MAG: hypothetical protein NBV60_01320 [Erythrobacter sp.]|nr:hypothetical protein [Erythrobacter sp.]
MAPNIRALALAGAITAATAFAVPVQAAAPATTTFDQSAFGASRFDPASTSADWRCRGGRCNRWGHRGWRRDRVDAGDVLIGAAILGGVIAIANSNNRRERERDVVIVERDGDWRDDNRRFDDRRTDRRNTGSSGLDSAVDQCLTRIERDVRVESVDNVERTGRGWLVSGALFNGSQFECRIGNDGRIEGVDFGGGFAGGDWGAASSDAAAPRADGQWSDQRYADARLAAGGLSQPDTPAPAVASGASLPAYPGGPVPGEDIPETIPEAVDSDIGG